MSNDVNLVRHRAKCGICSHPQLAEIEQEFTNWGSPARIAEDFGVSRDSIYRHAWATDLGVKRQRNVRAALERIIEQAGDVEANATAVVAAVGAYARINARGQWIDRSETLNLNELFERMTQLELEEYACNGTVPAWFSGDGVDREHDKNPIREG